MKISLQPGGLADLLMRLWSHLTRRRQRQFMLLTCLTPISAFAEVISLGAVLPFLGILISPGRVFKQPLVADLARSLGIVSPDQLVLPLTLIFIAAAVVAGSIRTLLLWVSSRLAFATGTDLSKEVYRRTLHQPYPVHLSRNSGTVDEELHAAYRELMSRAVTGVVDRDYGCLVPNFDSAINARKVADGILKAMLSADTVWN